MIFVEFVSCSVPLAHMTDRALGCVALTGAPGWLAHALLDALAGHSSVTEVRALALPRLCPPNPRLLHPRVDAALPYDLADETADPARQLEGASTLVHSAAVIHVRRTADWYRVNTDGTVRLARAARKAGVRRFVFISSNAAGGRSRSADHILTEQDKPQPLSHYGRSKWLAEQELMRMHAPGAFEVVVLRPSMFYGPPVPDRHIDVYRRIRDGRFPVIGSGRYRRSVTYIDHLVQAVMLACTRPQAAGQTYYVVDREPSTTLGICEAMAAALDVPLRKLWLPSVVGPVAYWSDRALAAAGFYWQTLHLVGESHWHVGISSAKLQSELGYQPAVTLEEGMKRAVQWCRQNGRL